MLKSTMKLFMIVVILAKIQIQATFKITNNDTKFNVNTSYNEDTGHHQGLLYPRESESREVKSLDGLWDFVLRSNNFNAEDFNKSAYQDYFKKDDVMQMPVPSSYNDIPTSAKFRDHVGTVWYARNFFIPYTWEDKRVFIRFGSVNYDAKVFINGEKVMGHTIGHLPFESEITKYLDFGQNNRIAVEVSNMLKKTTVPQGDIIEAETDSGTAWIQSYTFDFFNYAGIHRTVLLHTKPKIYIDDITVKTKLLDNVAAIKYKINAAGFNQYDKLKCKVNLRDEDDELVTDNVYIGLARTIKIQNATLWWPRGMSPHPGYMYTLEVRLSVNDSAIEDIYRLPVGIRTLNWTDSRFLINNRPVYMRGFGRHEDSVLRGRGLDLVTMTRDYELLKWVGANAFRTSHYPYSDEILDMADRQGFLVINECPSVDTDYFSPILLERHKSSITQLIRRDKNRPSVIMWSITNEPRLKSPSAADYFKEITTYTRAIDPTRPITGSLHKDADKNSIAAYFDIISFNRYNAWYQNIGRLDMIIENVMYEADAWHNFFKKPVLISEYGADAMPGLHELPETAWSEEYQTALYSKHFEAFDNLRTHDWFIGEFIWNFADFRTPQAKNRVGGNRKGVFTRTREPKMSAHLVRKRYHSLSYELDGRELPEDLEYYVSSYHLEL